VCCKSLSPRVQEAKALSEHDVATKNSDINLCMQEQESKLDLTVALIAGFGFI